MRPHTHTHTHTHTRTHTHTDELTDEESFSIEAHKISELIITPTKQGGSDTSGLHPQQTAGSPSKHRKPDLPPPIQLPQPHPLQAIGKYYVHSTSEYKHGNTQTHTHTHTHTHANTHTHTHGHTHTQTLTHTHTRNRPRCPAAPLQ